MKGFEYVPGRNASKKLENHFAEITLAQIVA